MNLYVTKIDDVVRERRRSLDLTLFFSCRKKEAETSSSSPASRLKTLTPWRLILMPMGQVVVCAR